MTSSIGSCLRITAFGDKGGRKYMEDYFSVAYQQSDDLTDLEFAFFGIFDGHGGAEAAKFAKDHLMNHILEQKGFYSDDDQEVLKAIKDGYLATHHAMWKNLDKWPKTASGLPSTAGTTASVAFIRRGKIYIGHVGDSGIVLGIENNDERKTWRAKQLTEDHKPESVAEKTRIANSGGKVIVKSGVPRVVWNRPRIGHKGPIRRSTHIDEIPFLAVARSLGDLWSYNSELDEFVVSPEPDVHVIKIDPNKFKCLIFGTDGLWNVLSAEAAVDLVRYAEQMNNSTSAENTHEWKNPSRCLVESALQNWNKTKLRADNTSVVTIMLDPPNKKNLLKIYQTPVNTQGELHQTVTGEHLDERNAAIFDYNTREAYNLESFSNRNQMSSAINVEHENRLRVSNGNYCHSNQIYESYTTSNSRYSDPYSYNNEPYNPSLFHTSLSHDPYQSPSTSQYFPNENETLHNNFISEYPHSSYSLTNLQSKTERESSSNHHENYHHSMHSPLRHMGYNFGAGTSATSTPGSYHHHNNHHQEMNVLPSIHNFVNDHHHHFNNKFNMERYDYMNYNTHHYHHNMHHQEPTYHELENYGNVVHPTTNIVEDEPTELPETSGDDITEKMEVTTDDSIQINEISSSFADDVSVVPKVEEKIEDEKEETEHEMEEKSVVEQSEVETVKKIAIVTPKRIRGASHQNQPPKKRIFYETRLTKVKHRSCNSIYSQKSLSASNSSAFKQSNRRKPAKKKVVVVPSMADMQNLLSVAVETNTSAIERLNKCNTVKNKENNNGSMKNSLRNSIRIHKQNLPLIEKESKNKNQCKMDCLRNSKMRKLK